MASESFHAPQFNNEDEHSLWLKNKLQVELMERRYGPLADDKSAEWIERHSANFQALFDKHMADPSGEFLKRYEEKPKEVLDEIEDELDVAEAA